MPNVVRKKVSKQTKRVVRPRGSRSKSRGRAGRPRGSRSKSRSKSRGSAGRPHGSRNRKTSRKNSRKSSRKSVKKIARKPVKRASVKSVKSIKKTSGLYFGYKLNFDPEISLQELNNSIEKFKPNCHFLFEEGFIKNMEFEHNRYNTTLETYLYDLTLVIGVKISGKKLSIKDFDVLKNITTNWRQTTIIPEIPRLEYFQGFEEYLGV